MNDPFPNRVEGGALRTWVLRAFMIGLAVGVMVAVAALLR
jgi:hypothetical protein